jgi:hypothetical protein
VIADIAQFSTLTTGVRFPGGVREFSLLHSVQTDSKDHPASYAMGFGGSFPGLKRQGREADHSPSSAEVKKSGAILPLPHISSGVVLNQLSTGTALTLTVA